MVVFQPRMGLDRLALASPRNMSMEMRAGLWGIHSFAKCQEKRNYTAALLVWPYAPWQWHRGVGMLWVRCLILFVLLTFTLEYLSCYFALILGRLSLF